MKSARATNPGKSRGIAAASIFAVLLCALASLTVPGVRADTEPNDTFANAEAITPGIFTGNIGGADANDFYKLITVPMEWVFANATIPMGLMVNLRIYNETQVEVESVMGVSNGIARVDHVIGPAQTVYIQIELSSGTGAYNLEIGMASQNDGGTGGDAGGDIGNSTTIVQGTHPSGLLMDADTNDFFNLTLAADGETVYVNVTVPATMTANLRLYEQARLEVASDIGVTDAVATVDFTFMAAQYVYIQVELAVGSGHYGMEVQNRTQDDCGSGRDGGRNFTVATPILSGNYSGNLMKNQDDNDYYSLTLTSSATVFVNVMVPTGLMAVNLYLFDETQAEVDRDTGANPGMKTVTFAFSTAQMIYVHVSLLNGGGLYEMNVSAPSTVIDLTAPTIAHTPVTTAHPGDTITITATITDDVGVQSATLYYRMHGNTTYYSVAMAASGDTYTATIPSSNVTLAGVEYYISATDGLHTSTAPAANPTTSPYQISVTEPTTDTPSGNSWIWIATVLIIILIVVVLLAMAGRKKPKPEMPDEEEPPEPAPPP